MARFISLKRSKKNKKIKVIYLGKFIDMSGWNMWEHGFPDSRLTIIKRAEDHIQPSGRIKVRWLCRCNCDNHTEFTAFGESIRSGHTLSCGCVHRERSSAVMKKVVAETREKSAFNRRKYCNYVFDVDKVTGWTVNNNEPFYFDIQFYDIVKDICWNDVYNNGMKRLVGRDRSTGKMVLFHQYIGYKNYDHIDRNELNNLLENLRPATKVQNAQNKSKQKNNTSGFIGVSWDKEKEKWAAYIRHNKKQLHLGYFLIKNDAIKARLLAEKEYFGDFAPQRHLFEEYSII